MQAPADHEGRTDRDAAPIVAQTVWIEETLKDAPGGVAEKPLTETMQRGWTTQITRSRRPGGSRVQVLCGGCARSDSPRQTSRPGMGSSLAARRQRLREAEAALRRTR